jgi:hypothetical protein
MIAPMTALLTVLCLTLGLTSLFALLGLVSLAFERGPDLLARHPRRDRARTAHRVRRRSARPRRPPGAAVPVRRPQRPV